MLLKLNSARNNANAIHAIRLFQEPNVNEYVVRFPFKKIIIDKHLPRRNGADLSALETQMKRLAILLCLRIYK